MYDANQALGDMGAARNDDASGAASGPRFSDYCRTLNELLLDIKATDIEGEPLGVDRAIERTIELARRVTKDGRRLLFIGNGGSAAIASHMAIDFSNWGLRAAAFNDLAALTCLANDVGYVEVFARQIAIHGCSGDLLFAISSSGQSPNILRAVDEAIRLGCHVVTLSGFSCDNSLSRAGNINFHCPFDNYGHVELSHLCLCHAILDFATEAWPKSGDRGRRWFAQPNPEPQIGLPMT